LSCDAGLDWRGGDGVGLARGVYTLCLTLSRCGVGFDGASGAFLP
jgi:hypothetical protein